MQVPPGVFFFNDTATTEIYTLSLHDALPICLGMQKDFNAEVMPELSADRPPDQAIASAVRRHVVFGDRRKGEVLVNIRERRSLPPDQLAQVNGLRREYRDNMARVIDDGGRE